MDNIIVYIDDATYALQMLQPMLLSAGSLNQTGKPTRWILVGCAPRVTHRVSKWITFGARENWRGKWADKVFSQVVPLLQREGDIVVTKMAQNDFCAQTASLMNEHGTARVLDARRPKFGQNFQPVTPLQVQPNHGLANYVVAFAGAGLLVSTD